jgi:hypothetical protein
MSTQAASATSGSASQAGAQGNGTQTASGADDKSSTTQASEPKAAPSMLAGGEAGKEGTTDGQTGQGDKSKDGQSASAGELTITIPEGANVDEASLNAFKAFAKESGMTSEVASKLVAWNLERVKEAEASWRRQGEDWFKELENDPDFGKGKLEESQQSVRRAVARFFDNELLADLTARGLDNHPGLVKALKRIGETLKEDDSATGGRAGNGAARATADREAQLRADYPSMYPEQK